MFEKRVNEIKLKTEEKFMEYQADCEEILYNTALNDAVHEKSKSDLIRAAIIFIISVIFTVPLIYFYGGYWSIILYLALVYLLYCIFIGDHIRSKITNPYKIKSFKPELKSTKKGKK